VRRKGHPLRHGKGGKLKGKFRLGGKRYEKQMEHPKLLLCQGHSGPGEPVTASYLCNALSPFSNVLSFLVFLVTRHIKSSKNLFSILGGIDYV
jgi:hypothetical protein